MTATRSRKNKTMTLRFTANLIGIKEQAKKERMLRENSWIQTFTGKKFFPLDPKPEDICIEDIAHSLSMQCRFAGAFKRILFGCPSLYCNGELLFNGAENVELARYALLHDASEAYLTDIPRPLKHLPEFQFYRDAEKHLQEMIYIKFGLNPIEPKAVKKADWDMLCEEAMSPKIMSPLHPDWYARCKPLLGFSTLTPQRAEEIFLNKFNYLFIEL